jgi:hypothetical protein
MTLDQMKAMLSDSMKLMKAKRTKIINQKLNAGLPLSG